MPKMSPGDLRALLAAERADALSAIAASKLAEERAAALDYYVGDMSRDLPAPEGRSKAVSTDVADTVEGLMPSLMDIFTSGDEVVRFEPVGPEDVDAAQQRLTPHRPTACNLPLSGHPPRTGRWRGRGPSLSHNSTGSLQWRSRTLASQGPLAIWPTQTRRHGCGT
jgi:hypothetical protein